jgi:hypothetical protein
MMLSGSGCLIFEILNYSKELKNALCRYMNAKLLRGV